MQFRMAITVLVVYRELSTQLLSEVRNFLHVAKASTIGCTKLRGEGLGQ